MNTEEILHGYWHIIERYLPTSDQNYAEICEAILKAHYTYSEHAKITFEEYVHACIQSQLTENAHLE